MAITQSEARDLVWIYSVNPEQNRTELRGTEPDIFGKTVMRLSLLRLFLASDIWGTKPNEAIRHFRELSDQPHVGSCQMHVRNPRRISVRQRNPQPYLCHQLINMISRNLKCYFSLFCSLFKQNMEGNDSKEPSRQSTVWQSVVICGDVQVFESGSISEGRIIGSVTLCEGRRYVVTALEISAFTWMWKWPCDARLAPVMKMSTQVSSDCEDNSWLRQGFIVKITL
jgi:hypothetical protein